MAYPTLTWFFPWFILFLSKCFDAWCYCCYFEILQAMVSDGRLTLTCLFGDKFRTFPFDNISKERMDELCSITCSWVCFVCFHSLRKKFQYSLLYLLPVHSSGVLFYYITWWIILDILVFLNSLICKSPNSLGLLPVVILLLLLRFLLTRFHCKQHLFSVIVILNLVFECRTYFLLTELLIVAQWLEIPWNTICWVC